MPRLNDHHSVAFVSVRLTYVFQIRVLNLLVGVQLPSFFSTALLKHFR